MAENRQSCPGVRDGVPGDPRDTVKVELLETQSPEGATLTPAGKTPETGAGPCDDAHALTENCEIEPLYKGIKKILLLELALAGIQ